MNFFQRAFASLTRNKGKHILLFLLVAGFGTLMTGAIVLNQSISQTRDNMWRQLPPAVVIDIDHTALNEAIEAEDFSSWEPPPALTIDMIEPIVNLPYVESFDVFADISLYSRELDLVLLDFSIESDQMSLVGYPVVMMELKGITNPNVVDIQSDLSELVSGRVFTAEEMKPADPWDSVAMISQQLAELNGLKVGDFITLENNFYRYQLMGYEHHWGHYPDESIVDYELYTLKIIGLFDPVVIPDFASYMQEVHANNGIIVPLPVVHSITDFIQERRYQDQLSHGDDAELLLAANAPHRNIIFLSDATYIPSFIEKAQDLLPLGYQIATFSNSVLALERFDDSIDLFQSLSIQALWLTTSVAIVALVLVISLSLRDRKSEIGIYLALGEKKANVAKQMLLELLIPSILAIMLSLFLGNLAANTIGREMLVNEMAAGQDFNLDDYGWSSAGAQFQWFMDDRIDTLIENYRVSLDARAVALFWGVSMITVFIATIIPVSYLMRLNPKDILTFSQV